MYLGDFLKLLGNAKPPSSDQRDFKLSKLFLVPNCMAHRNGRAVF